MSLDLNVKAIKKNAYRMTKERGKTALRIRVPGGELEACYLDTVKAIAEQYGNGKVHLTTRQGFEIPGIPFEMMEEVNKRLKPLIQGAELDFDVRIDTPEAGYPAAGTRNISACIGNKVCPFANYNTTEFARNIEKAIYPNEYHVKVALTGCPNDCIKAHMQDFGIIGLCEPQYEAQNCIGCEACVKNCKQRVTGALTLHNGKVKRDERRCLGCGECVLKCPTGAWTRNPEKFYRLVIMGRTGKKNPRLAQTFLEWVNEEAIISVIQNTYRYIEKYIDRTLPKEHIGYIVDRTGYQVFKEEVLKGVVLSSKARVAQHLDFSGYSYEKDAFID
jgi:anaerobic sulfite reductase subunit C